MTHALPFEPGGLFRGNVLDARRARGINAPDPSKERASNLTGQLEVEGAVVGCVRPCDRGSCQRQFLINGTRNAAQGLGIVYRAVI
jgi:hypothetical protein